MCHSFILVTKKLFRLSKPVRLRLSCLRVGVDALKIDLIETSVRKSFQINITCVMDEQLSLILVMWELLYSYCESEQSSLVITCSCWCCEFL